MQYIVEFLLRKKKLHVSGNLAVVENSTHRTLTEEKFLCFLFVNIYYIACTAFIIYAG